MSMSPTAGFEVELVRYAGSSDRPQLLAGVAAERPQHAVGRRRSSMYELKTTSGTQLSSRSTTSGIDETW
jgi:hypothetical protein